MCLYVSDLMTLRLIYTINLVDLILHYKSPMLAYTEAMSTMPKFKDTHLY